MSSVNTVHTGRQIRSVSQPPEQGSNGHDIKRIDEIIRNARTTWFLLLGVLVFAAITLLGVKDVDFFAAQSETKLPLVGVSVPVEYFFWAGAALVTALYVYFHLYLELLWAALGRAPARIEGDPLSERISPWLVVEWALRYRDHLTAHRERAQRRLAAPRATGWKQSLRTIPHRIGDWFDAGDPAERSSVQRAMGWVGSLMSLSLVWLFGLLVLFYFWWRSMPAHIDWMSLWLGFLFTFALWMAWRSWRAARRMLDGRGWSWTRETLRTRIRMGGRTFSVFAALMLIMSGVTLVRTASDWWPGEHTQWKDYGEGEQAADWIELYRQDFIDHAAYWDKRWREAKSSKDKWHYFADRAYTDFFSGFIIGADLAEAQLVALPKDWLSRDEAEKEFRAEWAKREGLVYRDPFPDIPEQDVEAEFQAALQEARDQANQDPGNDDAPTLDTADFRNRWAAEKGLSSATPFAPIEARRPEQEFGRAWKARRKTWLETQTKPILTHRNLRRAHLQSAFFPGVKLNNARLEGAYLLGARLEGADLSGARLEGANIFEASLEGANLWGAKLEGAKLSGARLEGAYLSGARLEGADLSDARLEGANLVDARLEGADLSGARLEGAILWGASLEGANLWGARFEGAILWGARLEGADLRSARLFGEEGNPLVFSSFATLRAANFEGAVLRVADMSGIDVTDLANFHQTFGDGSVKIADKDRPSRWCKAVLSEADFFGRWRGYVDPEGNPWRDDYFNGHSPILPSHC